MSQPPLYADIPVNLRQSGGVVDYERACADMQARASAIHGKAAPEQLWLLEHAPLYTAGTSAKPGDLIAPDRFPVFKSGRGGQYTYHGPGQRVAYVMLDLSGRGKDIRCFVSELERLIIDTLAQFGVKAWRREGRVGVWVDMPAGHPSGAREAKIAAIGVRVRKWVTFHGVSINVNPDLSHFSGIVPCGISEHGVTSLADLGVKASMAQVDAAFTACFERAFGPLSRD